MERKIELTQALTQETSQLHILLEILCRSTNSYLKKLKISQNYTNLCVRNPLVTLYTI